MPTGQSGNPLLPYYNLGHDDWMRGKADPVSARRDEVAPSFRARVIVSHAQRLA